MKKKLSDYFIGIMCCFLCVSSARAESQLAPKYLNLTRAEKQETISPKQQKQIDKALAHAQKTAHLFATQFQSKMKQQNLSLDQNKLQQTGLNFMVSDSEQPFENKTYFFTKTGVYFLTGGKLHTKKCDLLIDDATKTVFRCGYEIEGKFGFLKFTPSKAKNRLTLRTFISKQENPSPEDQEFIMEYQYVVHPNYPVYTN